MGDFVAQATLKRLGADPMRGRVVHLLREGAGLLVLALAVLLLLSLVSYDPGDPGWSHTGTHSAIRNLGGAAGAWIADLLFYLLGYLAYLAPPMIGWSGWLVLRGEMRDGQADWGLLAVRWVGFVLTVVAGCALAMVHFSGRGLPQYAGGVLGEAMAGLLVPELGLVGSTVILMALFLAGFALATGLSWVGLLDWVGHWTLFGAQAALRGLRGAEEANAANGVDVAQQRARRERKASVKTERAQQKHNAREKPKRRKAPRIEPASAAPAPSDRVEREASIPLLEVPPDTELPPLSLLDPPREGAGGYSESVLEEMSRLVESKLRDFGVEVEVEAVHPGPVITRFELQPAPGVKASRISNLAKDLARSLSVASVRIVEVIPGKTVVGLEIPNEKREIIALQEILASREYEQSHSPLTLALGKDIGGKPVVADLARMPHLLVAGTTGSGKSVAINSMLLSLLYKSVPQQVRLILIDPKMLELSVYERVPHLLTPVVTDMKEAANALRWSVGEMERRYKLMSALGVRNIGGYNRKVKAALDSGEPIADPLYDPSKAFDPEVPAPTLEPLPYVVVVVDEFADMMMVVGKKVEELIARLAQKARAAGIHLVLATQRPSVDVITGLIKANIPTRIAFQVSSKVDSRTILDQVGAEQLLGHGDMLYLPPGTGMPMRVHGAFVDDHEVHQVVEFLRGKGEPQYVAEVLEDPAAGEPAIPGLESAEEAGEADPLYDQAVAIVCESRKASISYVQRRLKIGYNRAARMIEEMEAAGVVSPVQHNGSREVLVPPPPPAD